ncbi:MAG: tyrosine-type recombinase/integrase [Acidimicrobiales bacterium]
MSSIRRTPGGRWEARYRDPEGRQHGPTFATKGDARRFLERVGSQMQRGGWVDPKAGHISLEEYAGKWLRGRTDLRPATRGKYAQLLRLHILPRLGSAHVGSLAPSTIRAWYLELFEAHPVTADDAYRVLRAILNTAVADQCVAVNPCKVKGAGQVSSAERPTATLAEVAAAVAAMPERYRLALLLATWCQLRRGELLALRRADVDLLHGTIRVERAWVPPPGGKPIIGPPKSEKGNRTLAVPANMLPALTEHLERFTGPEAGAWLFPGKGATPINPRTLERHWERARSAAGRPDLHLHDLRHSGLTWSAASGATLAELMRRGGHATPAAALHYQHASQDRDAVIASALAKLATRAEVVPISERDGSLPPG